MEIPWVYALTDVAADHRRRVYFESTSGFIPRNTPGTWTTFGRAEARLLVLFLCLCRRG